MTPAEFARYCIDNMPSEAWACYLAIEECGSLDGSMWSVEVEVGDCNILAVYLTEHEAIDSNFRLAVADREVISKELTALGVRVCSTVEEWEKLIYPEDD